MTFTQQTLINTGTLARLTSTSKSTWEKMRVECRGPRYIKVRNLVWYRWTDVEAWMNSHEVSPQEIS